MLNNSPGNTLTSLLIDNSIASQGVKGIPKDIDVISHTNPWLGYFLHGCTAFLINQKDDVFKFEVEEGMSDIAITAAHCIETPSSRRKGFYYSEPSALVISFGKHNITVKNEAHQIDVSIVKTICHWKFNQLDQLEYDIAMLKLEKPVKFNQFVRPLALSQFALNDVDDCFVSGWGGVKSLRMSHFNRSYLINDDMTRYKFETFKHGSDKVSPGDSGSPLVTSWCREQATACKTSWHYALARPEI
uniref:Peptidase S1 domain-containing protein n=1 Tax=Romanomermis culicivorax TaxID=13658 RepID=A0A915KZQ1_ROMCU